MNKYGRNGNIQFTANRVRMPYSYMCSLIHGAHMFTCIYTRIYIKVVILWISKRTQQHNNTAHILWQIENISLVCVSRALFDIEQRASHQFNDGVFLEFIFFNIINIAQQIEAHHSIELKSTYLKSFVISMDIVFLNAIELQKNKHFVVSAHSFLTIKSRWRAKHFLWYRCFRDCNKNKKLPWILWLTVGRF